MTNKDRSKENCLHMAAKNGDKHFCAMIIYEAERLGFCHLVINERNLMNANPLFLLCRDGFPKMKSNPISDQDKQTGKDQSNKDNDESNEDSDDLNRANKNEKGP